MAFVRSFVVLFILIAPTFVLGIPTPTSASHPRKACHSDEFYYEGKDCCLPRGGPSVPHPPPPPEKSCPSSHYWNKDFSCCVPYNAPPYNAPPPQCSNGHEWNDSTDCCEPPTSTVPHGPKPSHTPHHHHHHDDGDDDNQGEDDDNQGENYDNQGEDNYKQGENHHGHSGYTKRSAISFCPRPLTACPISSLTGYDYECLDTTAELRSCGGCASTGEGQDCTAIKGAWNVGCEAGTCAVYTCALGFRVAPDGKSCEAI